MAEMNVNKSSRRMTIRHRGRGAQVGIYFGKLLRMFVYQSDWKVLPMAALIAGLVGMVIRNRFFINMEGTLMSSFAMVMVCIWNGCFNSIQVICRERDVIKREHRSGMHISSYIFSHMLYQALLCLAQTGVTLYVTGLVGVKYPFEGLITPLFIIDFGISMFLITYASDMLSLWVSCLAHTTTTAMTIMPFVLIFQLVFSGGMLTLPAWTTPLTYFTISNPGLKVVATQADSNHRPYATIANMVAKMGDSEITGTVTLGQVFDALEQKDNPAIAELRQMEIGKVMTVGEIKERMDASATFGELRQEPLDEDMTVGELMDMMDALGFFERYGDVEIDGVTTIGDAVDWLAGNADVQAHMGDAYIFDTTLGNLISLVGEDEVKGFLEEKAAEASYSKDYEYTPSKVMNYWTHLLLFILAFAFLSTLTLEFIDKDKR